MAGTTAAKLAELRRKTDRQLHRIVEGDLESGLTLAMVADAHLALGDRGPAERMYSRAEGVWRQAVLLQARIDGLGDDERRRLEEKAGRLRSLLEVLEIALGPPKKLS